MFLSDTAAWSLVGIKSILGWPNGFRFRFNGSKTLAPGNFWFWGSSTVRVDWWLLLRLCFVCQTLLGCLSVLKFTLDFFIHFGLNCFVVVMQFCSNRWSTHCCRWSALKQFTMFLCSPFFCIAFVTLLFRYIPDPVQNIALFFGWSSPGVIVPIDFARLSATISVPGFSSSVVKSPGSTIKRCGARQCGTKTRLLLPLTSFLTSFFVRISYLWRNF